jgi:hypothetical protein
MTTCIYVSTVATLSIKIIIATVKRNTQLLLPQALKSYEILAHKVIIKANYSPPPAKYPWQESNLGRGTVYWNTVLDSCTI